MNILDFPDGVYLIDFEFHPKACKEGNPPDPVCLVVREWPSGVTKRYWQSELKQLVACPFPVGQKALCVAFYASAEMDCFQSLGWDLPVNILDLYVEFRWLTNGLPLAHGNKLIGVLIHLGLSSILGEEKDMMRALILTGGPWSTQEENDILDYCETDVFALDKILTKIKGQIDLQRALLRGRYMKAVSIMQINGIPIDIELFRLFESNWYSIQDQLIAEIDQDFGVYEGRVFKLAQWEQYLISKQIPWPRLISGQLDMKDDTFRQMARVFNEVSPIRELRSALSEMRLSNLPVGDDGRNRCLLSPFQSKTGRNQPSNIRFIYGPSVWLRGLIKPREGWGLAYVDWGQQEFGIAAALSGDTEMMSAYLTGDPYLAFAKQARAIPPDGIKDKYEGERELFKQCALAVQYGMGEDSLASKINQPVAKARWLLELHRRTYKTFWVWSDNIVNEAILGGRLWTTLNWQIHTKNEINDRSLRNFPMQANGAEMLRLACIFLIEEGIKVCAPVHDAILIEAPLDELDSAIERTQYLMKKASQIILFGFELNSDVKVVRYPDRYMDKRGAVMWNKVTSLLPPNPQNKPVARCHTT